MKQLALTFFIILTLVEISQAATPVSVAKFTDKSGSSNCRFEGYDWHWWREYLGNGFKEILVNELSRSSRVQVLEREAIREIYDGEHELINSEEDVTLAKKKFKKAKYSFVGSVTEYEYCAGKQGASVNVGGLARAFGLPSPNLSVGANGAKAKIGIVLRLVNNETGEIVKSVFKSEEIQDSGFDISTDFGGYSEERTSPLDKASRKAIESAAREVLTALK